VIGSNVFIEKIMMKSKFDMERKNIKGKTNCIFKLKIDLLIFT
jgi:hypothetical protein